MTMPPITIRDVARKAGVGVGTVSRVLNESPSVSEDTRNRVLAAIEALDFAPSPIAQRLSRGKSMTIAVIAPFFTRRSYVERLQGVEHILSSSGYDLVLYNVESVERRDDCLRSVPRRERVDGMLILSLAPTDEEAARLAQTGVPTVLVDAYHSELSTVQIDDVAGAMTAVEHLIDLGHTRIAYLGETLNDNPFRFQPIHDRYLGYRQALQAAELDYSPALHCQGRYGWREASRMADDLLELAEPPTAIFAYSDTMAFGAMEAAQESGRQIPRDLSIIGFDDVEIAQYFQLTTVRQPLYETGARGAELLMEMVDSGNRLPVEHIYLPTELVVRRTTAVPSVSQTF
jgi:DNA-binding LacI/PurR family transcriptional regulator